MAQYSRLETQPKTRCRSKRVLTSTSATTRSDSDLLIRKQDNLQLKPYLLHSVMETGDEIGRGAFGVVFKIRRWGTICAAKKLQDLFLHPLQGVQDKSAEGTDSSSSFAEPTEAPTRSSSSSSSAMNTNPYGGRARASAGCAKDRAEYTSSTSGIQSNLDPNPHATRSSSDSSSLPTTNSKRHDILAKFEKECHLLSNLRHPYIVQFLGVYIEKASGTPVIVMEYLTLSLSNLVKNKPVIPRYLQISILYNITLGLAYLHGHTPSIIHRDLTANNILLTTNMVAKIADLGVASILDLIPKRSMKAFPPETAAYMPPEALAQSPTYHTKTDIFSFGVLCLHLVSQVWPIPTDSVQVVINCRLLPVSEVDRRKAQFDLMGNNHCLYQLTMECLQNDPDERPDISKVVFTMELLQSKFPLPSTSYLDLLQVLENNRNQLEAKGLQLAANNEQLQRFGENIEKKDQEIDFLKDTVRGLETQLVTKMKTQMMEAEKRYKSELDSNEAETTYKDHFCSSSSSPTPPTSPLSLLPTLSSFIWKKDADIPTGTSGSKGVFLEDKLYIGGGDCKDINSDRIIYEYDINGMVRKWTPLPSAPVIYFSMENVNGILVLVGGMDINRKVSTNQLTCWDKDMQRWIHNLPPMQTPRHDCSVASYKDWLLVAGGMNFKKPIYNVELLDKNTLQWQIIHPLPKAGMGMTSCIVKNTWCLLGGTNFLEPVKGETGPKEYAFSLILDENIATNRWTALADTPLYCSTAIPFGEHLMSVGGTDSPTSRTFNSSLFLYSSANEKWLYVGNMPSARSQATCVVLSSGKLVIIGGQERRAKCCRSVEILYC